VDFGGFICFGLGAITLLAGCAYVARLFYKRSPNRFRGLAAITVCGMPLLLFGGYLRKTYFLDEPLAGAAWSGDVAKVRSLLSRGADPEAEFEGRTALELATESGHTEIVAILRNAGAKK